MISVVIPCYNSMRLREVLASVASQTLLPKEVILVDDASTKKEALELLGEIEKDSTYPFEVRVERLEKNGGPSVARNKGWELAKEEYIAFLDADDRWVPEKLERQLAFMKSHPDVLLSCTAHDYQRDRPSGYLEFRTQVRTNFVAPPCSMVRRDNPVKFDPEMRFCEDYDWGTRMVQAGRVYLIPEVWTLLGRKPMTPGGASAERWKMRKGQLRMYRKLHESGHLGTMDLFYFTSVALLRHFGKLALRRA